MTIRTKSHSLFFLFILLLVVQDSFGQRHRKVNKNPSNTFSLGVSIGTNFSQVDGDSFTGFDKRGFTGGIKVFAYLNERASLAIDILYNQKGSVFPHGFVVLPNSRNDRRIHLQYVELPLLLKFKPHTERGILYLESGPVLSRLIDSKISENVPREHIGTVYQDIVDDFRPFELNFLAGFGFDFGKVDFGFRYNYAITKFYVNPDPVPQEPGLLDAQRDAAFLRNFQIGMILTYKIW